MGKFYEELGRELILYVRQLAWLGAAPTTKAHKHLKSEPDPAPQTRLQRLAADGLEPDMPPISCPWVVDYLMEVGPTEAGAMGPVPVSWREIDHWQQCLGIALDPWVTRLLRRLSLEFVAESHRAREADCPAPWNSPSTEFDREALSRKVTQTFRAIAMSTSI